MVGTNQVGNRQWNRHSVFGVETAHTYASANPECINNQPFDIRAEE
jgi:hypothetical protein